MKHIGYIEKPDGSVAKIEALGDRCVVKLDDRAKISRGGIHLPDKQYKAGVRGTRGLVVAVGPDVGSPLLFPGARVHIGEYSGAEFDLGDIADFYHTVHEKDVLAVELASIEAAAGGPARGE